jgi:hypothetical protein
MTGRLSARLTAALTLALALVALLATLLGPAQTSAQSRRACSTPTSQAKTKHAARTCSRSSRRGKKTRHSRKHHAKHAPAKNTSQTSTSASGLVQPAHCESGQTPVHGTDGTFSCGDGSEPECENGATPTASRKGNSLVCPVASEAESSSSAAECEEEGSVCAIVAGEQPCETSSSDGSSFSCESGSEA